MNNTAFLLKVQIYNASAVQIYEYTLANLSGSNARPSSVNGLHFTFPGTLLTVPSGQTITVQYNVAISTGGVYGGISGLALNFTWQWDETATVLLEPRGS
jgi:hypothetical protein